MAGGFYLVQEAPPGARLLVSARTARVTNPESVTAAEVPTLFHEIPLEAGLLVSIPRGVLHRGLGGAVVHVVTIPGFRPGAEIGVDHHLRAINERLGLAEGTGLPFHREGALRPIVR